MEQRAVLCVGDTASDVFIRLIDGGAHVCESQHGPRLSFPFGEKVPFDYAVTVEAGGNAANAAVGLARLGVRSAVAGHVGGDDTGMSMQKALRSEGIDTHLIQVDDDHQSNRNFVLWFGEDRTILVRHEIFDYRWADPPVDDVPHWLYLSSVGSDALEYYEQITAWLNSQPSVHFVFQPGTFQIAQGAEALAGLYRRADFLICNREEAVEISACDHGDMGGILKELHLLGPRVVIVTDGPLGAYASNGVQRLRVPSFPDPSPPKERTGAGDAFASALVAALVKGCTLEEALAWAPVNAMSVVQKVGSQGGLLNEKELRLLLESAPPSYEVTTW